MEEIWKDVIKFENYYQISNLGRIRSLRTNIIMKPAKDGGGYLITNFSINGITHMVRVHRLVAEAFVPNPNNHNVVNHKNSIRDDNYADNLEWCTQSQNIRHGFEFGFIDHSREKNGSSKLTEKQVTEIRLLKGKIKQINLAELYGVTQAQISYIQNNKKWRV